MFPDIAAILIPLIFPTNWDAFISSGKIFLKGEQPEDIGKERNVFFAEKYDSDWSILRKILIVVYYVLEVSAFIKYLSLSPLVWGNFFI